MTLSQTQLTEVAFSQVHSDPIALRAQALDEYLRQIEALLGSGRTEAALELVRRMRGILAYAVREPSA